MNHFCIQWFIKGLFLEGHNSNTEHWALSMVKQNVENWRNKHESLQQPRSWIIHGEMWAFDWLKVYSDFQFQYEM